MKPYHASAADLLALGAVIAVMIGSAGFAAPPASRRPCGWGTFNERPLPWRMP